MFCRSHSLVTLIFTTGQVGAVGEPAGQELEEIRVYFVSNPDVSLWTLVMSTCRTFFRNVFLLNFCRRCTLTTSFLRIAPLKDVGQLECESARQIACDWPQHESAPNLALHLQYSIYFVYYIDYISYTDYILYIDSSCEVCHGRRLGSARRSLAATPDRHHRRHVASGSRPFIRPTRRSSKTM